MIQTEKKNMKDFFHNILSPNSNILFPFPFMLKRNLQTCFNKLWYVHVISCRKLLNCFLGNAHNKVVLLKINVLSNLNKCISEEHVFFFSEFPIRYYKWLFEITIINRIIIFFWKLFWTHKFFAFLKNNFLIQLNI